MQSPYAIDEASGSAGERGSLGNAVRVRLKIVPGARRDEIVGPLGDRLKIRVVAPPEAGRANQAVRSLLAESLGVRLDQVELVAGQSSPEKIVRVLGLSAAEVVARLAER